MEKAPEALGPLEVVVEEGMAEALGLEGVAEEEVVEGAEVPAPASEGGVGAGRGHARAGRGGAGAGGGRAGGGEGGVPRDAHAGPLWRGALFAQRAAARARYQAVAQAIGGAH